MLYGHKALLPIENEAFPQSDTDAEVISTDESPVDEKELQEQLSRILNVQSVIHQEAAKNIDKAQKRQKKDYERRHQIKTEFSIGEKVLLNNLRRADRKGDKGCLPYDGPYFIDKVLSNRGVYQVKTMDGKMLKQKQNSCNLKKIQENEVKKKDTDETEIQIGMQMRRKVDGKKMNQKQKKFLEGQENETNNRDDNETETQDSKQLDGTQNDSSFKRVSDEQVKHTKVMIN